MTENASKYNGPDHIGIIMDGNGRWAQSQGLSRIKGHRQGVETCPRIIEACQELDIHYLTLYAFSAENWKRPESEVNALMELLELFLMNETETLVKQRVRLHAIGRVEDLPARPRAVLKKAMDVTRKFDEWHLTLALNYSSRNEIVDATKSIAAKVAAGKLDPKDLDWETISNHLYTKEMPDPDLIVRTSGETRLSNFLLMQSAYAEFYFTATCWPDFTKTHLEEAISYYNNRERRFGRTGEQIDVEASLSF
ncbi:isoprenyl transferase [Candidatus Pelagisphaera phototrophica]|uniref:isoprenyl transferase n=1 Tax=Candidatus Pelagisphaera phototrophica TaxID=2684113 RepID=UPI0019F17EB1|nr:isoprenyl transferase [Candidatus Pelagisphaera phototrophica]QXD31632.1 isoprenyl transferase [Candidatus Pelagisphaera phototrophica]